MSYALSPDMTLHPYDAVRQLELVALGVALEMGLMCYLTSTWREPRYDGDKSYHRVDTARDFDFHEYGGGRVDAAKQAVILRKLKARLPSKWFDVINEGDHFHGEYDPKM